MIVEIVVHDVGQGRLFFQIFTPTDGPTVLLTRGASVELPDSVRHRLNSVIESLTEICQTDGRVTAFPKIEPLTVELARAPKP